MKGRGIHRLFIYDINPRFVFALASLRCREFTARAQPRERREEARTRYFWVLHKSLLREQFMSYLLIASTLLSFSVSQSKTPVTLSLASQPYFPRVRMRVIKWAEEREEKYVWELFVAQDLERPIRLQPCVHDVIALCSNYQFTLSCR